MPKNLRLSSRGGIAMAIAAAAIAASPALAASAIDDCTVQISRSEVDYGRLAEQDISRVGNRKALDTQELTLNVSCPVATTMALGFQGENVGNTGFRFGPDGDFSLVLSDAVLDGAPVLLGNDAVNGPMQPRLPLLPTSTATPMRDGIAAIGKQLVAQVTIAPVMGASAGTRSDRTTYVGMGTFTLSTGQILR